MCSTELVEIMKSYLDSVEVEYIFEKDFFRFYTSIDGKIKNVCFIISLEEHGYQMSAIPEGVTVTDAKMTKVLEYVNMVNVKTIGPSMSVYEDIVMCSYALNCRGMLPNKEQIRGSLASIIFCLETFGGGIFDVIAGIGTPKEIFKKYTECDRYAL